MENLETLSDKELLNIMSNGKKEKAFNVLYNRYKQGVSYFCNKLCYNMGIGRDLTDHFTSVTFTNLFNSSENFVEKDAKFKTYLYRISLNAMIDYHRKLQREKEHLNFFQDFFEDCPDNRGYFSNIPSNDISHDTKIEIKQRNEFLRKNIDSLSKKYSNILKLRYFEELSYEEISNKLNISIGNVKAQLFNARKKLKDNLCQKNNFFKNYQPNI
jgi:RNA polymerase sigma factor (sigma-70 family)